MMKENNIATLKDKKGNHDVEFEINKNNKVSDYIEMRVRGNDGEIVKSYISIKDLYGFIFLIVGDKEQDEMMPVRKTEVRVYTGQHKLKLKKDMKKGEIVVANYTFEVPLAVEEGLYGLIKRKAKQTSRFFLPAR